MMEVNITNPDKTATHATDTIFCSGLVAYYVIWGILWLYSAHCLHVRQSREKISWAFPMPKCNFVATDRLCQKERFQRHLLL